MRKHGIILVHGFILGAALCLCNNSIWAKLETFTPAETEESEILPFDELRNFTEIFTRIKLSYVEPVSDQKLFEEAIRGMLSDLDPHTGYMVSDEYDEFQKVTTGQFVGLGLEVDMENGFVKVVSPMDDTPAQRAGIKAGDLIVGFDNKPVKDLTPADSIKLMRGEIGTGIVLTVVREGQAAPLKFALTREIIKSKSVKQRLLEKNYGYLRIGGFQPGTGQSLLSAIESLNKENGGALNGLVLDLRDNPGGVVNDAVEVCDAFLDSGLIVFTKGRMKNAEMRFNATANDVMHGAPIVVLINGGSASAAEIVAGALQDHGRAIIMGEKSFGKGSVQTVIPSDSGAAIKLTIARYFTPSGRSIQAEGIQPDVTLARVKMEPVDQGKFETLKEADLVHHLTNGNGEKVSKSPEDKTAVGEALERAGKKHSDYAVNEALNLLKGLDAIAHISHPAKL